MSRIRAQLRDLQKIVRAVGQIQQLHLPFGDGDGCIGGYQFTDAGAIYVGNFGPVQEDPLGTALYEFTYLLVERTGGLA